MLHFATVATLFDSTAHRTTEGAAFASSSTDALISTYFVCGCVCHFQRQMRRPYSSVRSGPTKSHIIVTAPLLFELDWALGLGYLPYRKARSRYITCGECRRVMCRPTQVRARLRTAL